MSRNHGSRKVDDSICFYAIVVDVGSRGKGAHDINRKVCRRRVFGVEFTGLTQKVDDSIGRSNHVHCSCSGILCI